VRSFSEFVRTLRLESTSVNKPANILVFVGVEQAAISIGKMVRFAQQKRMPVKIESRS
jgi:hypothetical protein